MCCVIRHEGRSGHLDYVTVFCVRVSENTARGGRVFGAEGV